MITLYGISNCDQIKHAKRWLETHQVEYHFHDYRKDGVPEALTDWLTQLGDRLINRKSSSWRALTATEKQPLEAGDAAATITQLNATPTLIKRPLLVVNNHILVGFDESQWRTAISASAS